jgi:hypothetical protein
MTIYVAEISGRAIAAMNAENVVTAEDWLAGPIFHSELLRLKDEEGDSLWDGEAEIHVRPALPREEAIWEEARDEAVADGDFDEDEDQVLVFLIPVIDEDTDHVIASSSKN